MELLGFVYVPDTAISGAFEDVNHIAHVASPHVVGTTDAEQDVMRPAISGTTSMLQSAPIPSPRSMTIWAEGPATHQLPDSGQPEPRSQCVAYDVQSLHHLLCWQEPCREGSLGPPREGKAKMEVERCLPYVHCWTERLVLAKGAKSLNSSQELMSGVAESKPEDDLLEVDFPGWVDVRDVAKAHIPALQALKASGERFILAPVPTTYSEFTDLLRRELGLNVSRQKQTLDCYSTLR